VKTQKDWLWRGLGAVVISAVLAGAAAGCTTGEDGDRNEVPITAECPQETAGSELYQIASRACGPSKTVRSLAPKPLKSEPERPKQGNKGTDEQGCPGVYQGGKWVLDPSATLCFLPMTGLGNEGVYLALGVDGLGKPPLAFVRRVPDGRVQVYFPSVSLAGRLVRMYAVLAAGDLSVSEIFLVGPDASLQPGEANPAEVQNVVASILAYRKVHSGRL
jgi:hypothetical protein